MSLSASCSFSSQSYQRTHVYDISPCPTHSAFLYHMAGAFRRVNACSVSFVALRCLLSNHTGLTLTCYYLSMRYKALRPALPSFSIPGAPEEHPELRRRVRHHGRRTGAPAHNDTQLVRPQALPVQALLPPGNHAISDMRMPRLCIRHKQRRCPTACNLRKRPVVFVVCGRRV